MTKKIKLISEATCLITWLVVETCLERVNIEPTTELVNGMVARANYHFNNKESFKKGILGSGNKGRDFLYSFVENWIEGKYWERYNILPKEYLPYQEDIPQYKT